MTGLRTRQDGCRKNRAPTFLKLLVIKALILTLYLQNQYIYTTILHTYRSSASKIIFKCREPILLLPVSNSSSILILSTFTSLWMCNNASPFSPSSTIVVLFHCLRRLKEEKDRSHSTDPIGILPWHLLGHAIMSVICFDLQFSRPMTSFCIFIAYINTEGILFNVKITRCD